MALFYLRLVLVTGSESSDHFERMCISSKYSITAFETAGFVFNLL